MDRLTNKERRKAAGLLREAARIVAEGDCGWKLWMHGSPYALWLASDRNYLREGYRLADMALFKFIYDAGFITTPMDEDHRNTRVIALLLTAEAVESGDA